MWGLKQCIHLQIGLDGELTQAYALCLTPAHTEEPHTAGERSEHSRSRPSEMAAMDSAIYRLKL